MLWACVETEKLVTLGSEVVLAVVFVQWNPFANWLNGIPAAPFRLFTVLMQNAKAAVDETRALQTQIRLAEAAKKQAQGSEMDYEEVIHLLEEEITEMKSQRAEKLGQPKV